jgi:hypothetical protein
MIRCWLPEVKVIQIRVWIRSGIAEALDARQVRLLELVQAKTEHYYGQLYQTRPCYQHPLSLTRLTKLCRRNSATVASAIKYLAHTVPAGSSARPALYYDRVPSERNPSHRPHRIFLRRFRETSSDGSELSRAIENDK